MNWNQLRISTSKLGLELLSNRLIASGVDGFEVEDPDDFQDFLNHKLSYYDYVDECLMEKRSETPHIVLYLPDTEEGQTTLLNVEQLLTQIRSEEDADLYGDLAEELALLNEEDWANNWKQYYKNIEIEKKLIISPLWEEVPPDQAEGKAIVKLDPGMAFGTGTHETTRLCLRALCHTLQEGQEVLDLGCGSGILGIAALKLGAACVTAVDIDPLAVKIAGENAGLNQLGQPEFTVYAGDVLTDQSLRGKILSKQYDLVLCNIVADVVIPLTPFAAETLKDTGTYVVSGIIENRVTEVLETARLCGLTPVSQFSENDWYSIVFVRAQS